MKTKVAVPILAAFFVAATLVVASPSRADSMRCGTRLVEVGDSAETLFEASGEGRVGSFLVAFVALADNISRSLEPAGSSDSV